MPSPHGTHAAADTAGFKRVQLDRGAIYGVERYMTRYEKSITGGGSAGGLVKIEAYSGVSQADADTKALASLNAWRDSRYGYAAAGGSKDERLKDLTVDRD